MPVAELKKSHKKRKQVDDDVVDSIPFAETVGLEMLSDEENEEAEEAEDGEGNNPDPARARAIYERAYRYFKAECARPEVKDDVEQSRKFKAQVRIIPSSYFSA